MRACALKCLHGFCALGNTELAKVHYEWGTDTDRYTDRQAGSVERAEIYGRYNPLTTGRRVEQKFWLTEPDWNRICDIRIMNRAGRGGECVPDIYDMIYAGHGHYYFEIRRNCSLIFRLWLWLFLFFFCFFLWIFLLYFNAMGNTCNFLKCKSKCNGNIMSTFQILKCPMWRTRVGVKWPPHWNPWRTNACTLRASCRIRDAVALSSAALKIN